MSRTIQIRNVPDTLHRTLKARAARAGMSLSAYLLKEIREVAERPTLEEMRARLQHRTPVKLSISSAEKSEKCAVQFDRSCQFGF